MEQKARLIVYPSQDLTQDKAIFNQLLGTQPYVDSPYYVGYRLGDQEIGLDPNGPRGGPITYWYVDDIQASLQALIDAGAQAHQDVKNIGGGAVMAQVTDAAGNRIGLVQGK